jgi:hypothetical protein
VLCVGRYFANYSPSPSPSPNHNANPNQACKAAISLGGLHFCSVKKKRERQEPRPAVLRECETHLAYLTVEAEAKAKAEGFVWASLAVEERQRRWKLESRKVRCKGTGFGLKFSGARGSRAALRLMRPRP